MSNRRKRAYRRKDCDGYIAPGAWKLCDVCGEPGKIALCHKCLAIQCLRCFDKADGCRLEKGESE